MRGTKISAIGSNAERSRTHNRRVVLEHVRANEPTGRAEIARSCGLSIQAVSNITEALEFDGLLRVSGRTTGMRGKPAAQYTFNPEGVFAIGIELQPDAIICAILNLSGERIYSDYQTLKSASPRAVVLDVQNMIERAIVASDRNPARLLGVGVVMPGPFGVSGLSDVGGAVLPGWDGVDTKTIFEQALGCPVIAENDATAAAISERVAGVASAIDTFCFIYFGTGLGLGVITNGHAQRGAFGNLGEIGHVVTQTQGALCTCGNHGCLEVYSSRMSAINHLGRAGLDVGDGTALAQLMKDENPELLNWVETAALHLSQAIGIVENLFDPETIILGGAMPDTIIDALIAKLDLPTGSVSNRKNRIIDRVIRGSSGRLTAAIGGAAMIIHKTITPAMATHS